MDMGEEVGSSAVFSCSRVLSEVRHNTIHHLIEEGCDWIVSWQSILARGPCPLSELSIAAVCLIAYFTSHCNLSYHLKAHMQSRENGSTYYTFQHAL